MTLRRLVPGLVLALALVAPAAAQNNREQYLKSSPQLLAALTEVLAKPSAYTVRVRCDDKDVALGTIVEANGYILTKFSELKYNPMVKFKDGKELPATLVGVHPQHDLALLKVDAKNLPVADWREAKDDAVGSWVAAPGLGKEPVGVGVISVATRNVSGGPRVAPNPNGGYMGVRMSKAENGVRVEAVEKDTPAEKAGLKQGDIIVGLNDRTVADNDDMLEILGKKKPGDVVTVKVKRKDEPLELKLTLGKRPANRGDIQNTIGGHRLSERRSGFPAFLQHDTVLKPEECGGPLVDLDGKTIGINIARAGRTETYAIPSETIRPLIAELKTAKYAPPVPTERIKELQELIKKVKEEQLSNEKKLRAAEEELKRLTEKK